MPQEAGASLLSPPKGASCTSRKQCPDKEFYLASEELLCPNMKLTTLEKVHRALVPEHRGDCSGKTRKRAERCLERMLEVT